MRILFLHSQIPWPANTGAKIRTYQLIKNLAAEHQITLACFGQGEEVPQAIREVTAATLLLPGTTSGRGTMLRALLRSLGNRLPFSVNKYKQKAAVRAVAQLWQQQPFDLVHVDQPHMAVFLRPEWRVPVLIHEHNVESQIARRFYEQAGNKLLKAFLYLQYRRMERFEQQLWHRYDQVVAVSEQDRQTIRTVVPDKSVPVVENGVDLDYYTYRDSPGKAASLIYVGSMDWLPNEDAMVWFARSIFPAIRRQRPDCELTIVGRAPSEPVRRLAEAPGIRVTGTVDDVRPFLAEATLLVVPLRIGGGSRLKILEAMSAGLPVVSTSIGCEGLAVEAGKHLLIADSPERFAADVHELLGDPELQKKLRQAGRKLVVERYSWATMASQLSAVYREMARQ